VKKTFFLLSRPVVWSYRFLRSGLTVLSNLLFLALVALVLFVLLYKPQVQVPMHSALLLAPEGDIVEQRSSIGFIAKAVARLSGTPMREDTFLQDIVDVVHAASGDPRIKLLVLNTNRMGNASLDQIRTIGSAIEEFKRTGKKVIAVGDSFNQAQYYLASWADKINLHPMGAVNMRGFSVFRLYARELIDKLAIDFHVFRVGTFKAAVEPLLRDNMSAEDKEATGLWLGKLWDLYCDDIVKHRGLERQVFLDNVNQTVSQLGAVGGDRARLALATGLVDGLKNRQEMEQLLIQEVGPAPDKEGFNCIGFQEYLDTITPSYTDDQQKKDLIGIIIASGNILPGKGAVDQIGSDDLVKRIRKARQDARVKAIVLRITTGGGSAFASEMIREELAAAKKDGKIVVVSMGAMAASGGYWLAAEADAIVAAPTTLTGSIGIFGAIPVVDKTLAQIGLHSDGIGTTDIAHFGNLTRPMSEAEASTMQMDVERGYHQFIDIVAKGRHMSADQVEKIAEGRVWEGATALSLGLVDRLGDLQDAVDEAAKRANIPAANGYYIELMPDNYLDRFKRVEQPVEALVARFWPATMVPDSVRRPIAEQMDIFLPDNNDPEGLYSHCLLPLSALSFR